MDMLVGVASGQPAGVPFQPTFGVQLDFGTPPPEPLRKRVKAQAGLSGVINRSGAIWTDARTTCTNALASHFVDPVMRVPLLTVPTFMAAPPWREIPFEKVWMVEGGTPNVLLRRGLRRDCLAPGTEIIVDGYQTKNHALKRANGRDVTFTDGNKIFMGSSGTGAPYDRDRRDREQGRC